MDSSVGDTVRGDSWQQSCILCRFLIGLSQLDLHDLGLFYCVWGFIFSGFLPTALALESPQLRKSYLSSTSMMQESLLYQSKVKLKGHMSLSPSLSSSSKLAQILQV
ncbi:mCG147252 [Mus musculus]|uniref:Uncharacterized protein n=1 Tax=Mus musculus TaxID=10090 RepID=Q8C4K5_MOUSE|nr:mCG147252 [Mus musculus]BAC38345.1 unnamed protein product [Mus musculus]